MIEERMIKYIRRLILLKIEFDLIYDSHYSNYSKMVSDWRSNL